MGESGGHVQHPESQQLRLSVGEVAVQGEQLELGDEIGGDRGELGKQSVHGRPQLLNFSCVQLFSEAEREEMQPNRQLLRYAASDDESPCNDGHSDPLPAHRPNGRPELSQRLALMRAHLIQIAEGGPCSVDPGQGVHGAEDVVPNEGRRAQGQSR
jgi:hypothetical protein